MTSHELARNLLAGPNVNVNLDFGDERRMRAEWTESSDDRWQAFLATEPDWNAPEEETV